MRGRGRRPGAGPDLRSGIPTGPADARFERVTNLVTFLLHTRRPVSLQEVVDQVPGYPEGRAALRQAFERDKRVLREEGVPLTEENGRYRIRPEDYYLPQLDLTTAERMALNVAVAAVSVDPAHARAALRKLGGSELGDRLSDGTLGMGERLVDLAALPALPVLHAAVRDHAVVRFAYRGEQREVEPYGLLFREGHWYVAGHDRGRGARRSFRVDRIEGAVQAGSAAAFDTPANFDPAEALARRPWLIGGEQPVTAVVSVDGVLAGKVAAELGEEAVRERRPDGSAVFAFPITNQAAFRAWVLGLLDHAEVLGPPQLRSDVTAWLEATARRARPRGA